MSEAPRTPAPREIGAIIRQTADLRRLCLSLREAGNCEQEARLAAEFDRAVSTPEGPARMDLPALRAGFRNLWKGARYDRIVAVGRILSKDLIEADETVLMYYTCALKRQAESASWPEESA
jgi:streptomycin 6-kinase